MKKRGQQKIARTLFKKSLTGGYVNSKNVKQILKEIVTQKPPQLTNILKIYKKLIEGSLGREQILVESAQKIIGRYKLGAEILRKTGAKRIIYKINPKIVIGAKITHGDWVWDETLQAKLSLLTNAN